MEMTIKEAKEIILASAHCKNKDLHCDSCIFFADTRCTAISADTYNETELAALDVVERSIGDDYATCCDT